MTLRSGRPFTLFVGFDANIDGNPVTDRVGDSSRNTYRGDSPQTADLRLSRALRFAERKRFNLAVDAFNLLNRNNVDEIPANQGPYFGLYLFARYLAGQKLYEEAGTT